MPRSTAKRTPAVARVANCASVSARTTKSRGAFKAALTKPGRYGRPDVVLAMECSDFAAELLAEEVGWEAIQYGRPTDVALRGSVIAYNPEHVRLLQAKPPILTSHAGDGVRDRYTVRAKLEVAGHREWFNAGHAPPDRSEKPQRQWYNRIRHLDGIFGADFNDRPDFIDERYGRQVCAVRGDVLALLVPKRIPVSPTVRVEIPSDHWAEDTCLWPEKKEHRHA